MVSIIIPVLNEEKNIVNFLQSLDKLQGHKELIVVDGYSEDNTAVLASQFAKVVLSKRGRAFQMNEGAKVAKGNILWFLHSDSIVKDISILAIEETIGNGAIAGGFPIYFYDYKTLFMKYIWKTSNLRAGIFNIFYGDQGIFVRKDIFMKVGGYPEIEIMEDIELSLKLKKLGKLTMTRYPIGTSGRRFKKGGPLRTHLLMHKLRILYMLGVSPKQLNKLYREVR
ncbi:TIGR04283 family arsenosugar biosynthesis glycosyltransferase [Clostridium sp. CX1]|uniref:TIGR04283 family arsenosugar biosynthesis glycosyltransferase n=1 Tax=Clostridium sp. CX1 TaxID=2978346 RepID=UPI0021C1F933|nr:TIGR04283 family arsenosugar biosynthesis glycosyltransferase [Clostridium sp. CX1]MCT8977640.1 TIGR04283 family arsenosugar biosynthesis glycosyltransferase [Clostridium sp. CX1]